MDHFNWRDEYNIDHGEIDAQHQHLFDLANKIMTITDDDELTQVLMQFYQHIRVHFSTEENVIKESSYPYYQKHTEAHNQMLDRLVEISKTVYEKNWNTTDIKHFVNHWVLEHILNEDMQLAQHLKSNKP